MEYKLYLSADGFKGTDVVFVDVEATQAVREATAYVNQTIAAGVYADMDEAYKSIVEDGINALYRQTNTTTSSQTQAAVEVQIDPLERERLEAIRAATGQSYSQVMQDVLAAGLRVQQAVTDVA